MKRYFTLFVLAAASLPVFAANLAGNVSETDFASITLVMLGAAALVATRRLNHH